MTVTWITQKTTDSRQAKWYETIKSTCNALELDHFEIDIVPFERSVVGGAPNVNSPVIVHGSTAIITVAERMNWQPGVFRIFKESETLNAIGSDYLNHDMRVLDVHDVVEYVDAAGWDFFFAKPDKDLKSFDGTVFDKERFPFFIERVKQYSNYDTETKICVSPIKHIGKEWRVFVVDGRAAAYSQYRNSHRLSVCPDTPADVIEFAESIAGVASPSPVFVVDVCELESTLKVIEFNTFNCSGFYECDVSEIVKSVSEYVQQNSIYEA